MNDSWKSFLIKLGASYKDDQPLFHSSPREEILATANNTILADLSHLSLVSVTGDDADSFLQSQLSNDINLLTGRETQLSAYCNPKGRVLTLFRLFKHEGQTILILPTALLPSITQRLQMYIMRSKVKLTAISDQYSIVGVAGSSAVSYCKQTFGSAPEKDNACFASNGITLIRIMGIEPRFLAIGQTETLKDVVLKLKDNCSLTGSTSWIWLDICAGQALITTETNEQFIPQMLNLDSLDGINFKKGCFPGQEIIARMRYLGKLKKRLYRFHIELDEIPAPGTAIYSSENDQQAVGHVVIATTNPDNGSDLLAVVQIQLSKNKDLFLENYSGTLLQLKNLPYIVA